MSTYNVPNISGDELSGLLNSYGGGYSMTPDGSGGYNVNADSASGIGAALGAGSQSSSSSSDYGTLAGVFGNADTSNEGAGSGLSNNNGDKVASTDKVSEFFSKFGADAIAIVVGLAIFAAAIVKIV